MLVLCIPKENNFLISFVHKQVWLCGLAALNKERHQAKGQTVHCLLLNLVNFVIRDKACYQLNLTAKLSEYKKCIGIDVTSSLINIEKEFWNSYMCLIDFLRLQIFCKFKFAVTPLNGSSLVICFRVSHTTSVCLRWLKKQLMFTVN